MNYVHSLMASFPGAIILLGVAVGLAGYSLCYLFVSRRPVGGGSEKISWRLRRPILRRCGFLVLWAGIAAAVAAIALKAALDDQGLLEAEGSYTLRASEGLEVKRLTDAPAVKTGDFLAQFRSAELEAKAEALTRRQRALEESKRVLSATPIEIDAELVRKEQQLDNDRRHYLAALERLSMERDEITRDHARDRVQKVQELSAIEGTLSKLQGELEQARSTLNKETRELKSSEPLFKKRLVSEDYHAGHQEDVDFTQAEVEKVKHQLAVAGEEKQRLEQGLANLRTLAEEQIKALNREIGDVRSKLTRVANDYESLHEALAADRIAAEARRQNELQQIDYEIAEYQETMLGIDQTLSIVAPFAGSIEYKNPAPRTVHLEDPLIVLAPPGAFVLRLRLPVSEVKALADAGEVALELVRWEAPGANQAQTAPREHLVRRFPAQLRDWQPLQHEAGIALAELTTTPSADAVRDLASGDQVKASLKWMPPLFALPMFVIGALIAGVGALGIFVFRATSSDPERKALAPVVAAPAGGIFQLDTDDAALRMLGGQLRNSILREEIDGALLATIEWSIDRRGVDAVRLLSEGFADHADLRDNLDRMIREYVGASVHAGLGEGVVTTGQLIRVLRTVAPGAASATLHLVETVSGNDPARAEKATEDDDLATVAVR